MLQLLLRTPARRRQYALPPVGAYKLHATAGHLGSGTQLSATSPQVDIAGSPKASAEPGLHARNQKPPNSTQDSAASSSSRLRSSINSSPFRKASSSGPTAPRRAWIAAGRADPGSSAQRLPSSATAPEGSRPFAHRPSAIASLSVEAPRCLCAFPTKPDRARFARDLAHLWLPLSLR